MLLCYITDRNQLASDEPQRRERLLACVRTAGEAGVDIVQLREKDLPVRELLRLAEECVRQLHGGGTKLLVNSRMDVAIAAGASGVHLPSGDEQVNAGDARVILAKAGIVEPIVSVACHTLAKVELAESYGADFALFGPAFEKDGVRNATGLAALREVCARTGERAMPVLALGGVTLENAAECIAAGGQGIAAIRLFQSGDVRRTVQQLRKLET